MTTVVCYYLVSLLTGNNDCDLIVNPPSLHRKVSQGQVTGIPYGYPTAAGFLPVDQSGIRPAAGYPFMIPGQYVAAQMPYQQVSVYTYGQSTIHFIINPLLPSQSTVYIYYMYISSLTLSSPK